MKVAIFTELVNWDIKNTNCDMTFYTLREIKERFTCCRDKITGEVFIVMSELAKDTRFFRFSWGRKRACSRKFDFSNF